jgi:hypothetical protein
VKGCDRLAAAAYVLVVHTTKRNVAHVAYGQDSVFEPGYLQGRAYLYELVTARYLGGFSAEATNSESVTVYQDPRNPGYSNTFLEEDLESNYWAALQAQFQSLTGS